MGEPLLLEEHEARISDHRSGQHASLHGEVEGRAMVALELCDQVLRGEDPTARELLCHEIPQVPIPDAYAALSL
ncbi:unannotated protein [freshwater metagenome]|uniref:Unannotated protein n=1 Tax=freshwater metagenome TaxID=449393 RepID=A0A6J7IFF3_9ZZZZ